MPIDGATPLWVAARALLGARVDDLFRRREKVLATFDPEDIHDLRVASRRLREGLALFAPCYRADRHARLVKRVKGVTRLLGGIRNSDEAALFYSSLRETLDGPCRRDLERLVTSIEEARRAELTKLEAELQEMAGNELHDRCRRLVAAPSLFASPAGGSDPLGPVAAFARAALVDRLDDVLPLVPLARQEGAAEAQHLLRIAVKHYRYRMEVLSFLLGAGYRGLHADVKGYQDVLGKMHDLDVFAVLSREADVAPATAERVLEVIASRRKALFAAFTRRLETKPLERVGELVRNAL